LGRQVLLNIHDPIFLEKIAELIPDKFDRFAEHSGIGKHTTGEKTIFDDLTSDKTFISY